MDMILTRNVNTIGDVRKDLTESELRVFNKFCESHDIRPWNTILGWYRNGNYVVVVFPNGSRIKFNDSDKMIPAFADNIDLTITYQCDAGCTFCYQGCTPDGEYAHLRRMSKFLDSIPPFTQVAIGLNDLTHPDLRDFLVELSKRNVIANGTVNILHAIREQEKLESYQEQKLIYGLGISYNGRYNDDIPIDSLIKTVQSFKNVVVHTIAGVIPIPYLRELEGHDLNLLILGYKTTGRGSSYQHWDIIDRYQADMGLWLQEKLQSKNNELRSICFDTAALKLYHDTIFCDESKIGELDDNPTSINYKVPYGRYLTQEEYDQYYAGADGEYTFFIDLVKRRFGKNSSTSYQTYYNIPESYDVKEMFRAVYDTL